MPHLKPYIMKKITLLFAITVLLSGCAKPGNNNSSKKLTANKARVQQFYDEVINAHQVAMIDSFCTTDITDHNPNQGHSGKGIEDLKAQFTEMMSGMPDIHMTTNFMVAEGDTVVVYLTMSGTNSGAMGNMPATNKAFKIDGIDIVVLNGDKATNRWGIFDNMAMMAQLGMMGGAPPADAPMTDKK